MRSANGIIVAPFAIDEPTKASWDLSVTTDAHGLCPVTALLPPEPPQTASCIRCGEESGTVYAWTSSLTYLSRRRPTSRPMRGYVKLPQKARWALRRGGERITVGIVRRTAL